MRLEEAEKAMHVSFDGSYESWRDTARRLLAGHVPPDTIAWEAGSDTDPLLPGLGTQASDLPSSGKTFEVPKAFLPLAERVGLFRGDEKWDALYRLLWRLTYENRFLLELAVDRDVHRVQRMDTAVRRDLYRMKTFVRFVPVAGEMLAWHDPEHLILRAVCACFQERFPSQRWMLLTPDGSVRGDGDTLTFGPGVSARNAPPVENLEAWWKANGPALFSPKAALAKTSRAIPRRSKKPRRQNGATPLTGKKNVPGEGPADASVVFVGEQPGDQEDKQGRPFVGPAGKLLDQALVEAGFRREDVYLTNAVKRFNFVEKAGRRMHQKPLTREIVACRPELAKEVLGIGPRVLVLLGATAAQAVMGKAVRLADVRSHFFETDLCANTFVTLHPSAILRIPDKEKKAEAYRQLVLDLTRVCVRSEAQEKQAG